MSSTSDKKDTPTGLRAEYNGAFHEWAFEVNRLHRINQDAADSSVIEQAQDRVAEAEISYREVRDRLTDEIQPGD